MCRDELSTMSAQDRKGWLFEKSWPSSGRDCHFYGWANYNGKLIQGFCERINNLRPLSNASASGRSGGSVASSKGSSGKRR